MTNLDRLVELARRDHHLAVLITLNEDGSPQVSVVNCGVIVDPRSGEQCVALVARRGRKIVNLERRPLATLVVRAGWEWIGVTGRAAIIGADDLANSADFTALLRDIFHAAGGHHADLDEYDRVMVAEGRRAVLIEPQRFSTNPRGSDHKEPPS